MVFDFKILRSCFLPNAALGLIVVLVFITTALLGGNLSWLGFYTDLNEIPLQAFSMLVFTLGFVILLTVEEYFFRDYLFQPISNRFGTIGFAAITTVFFMLLKTFQFNITWMETINFGLLNLLLLKIATRNKSHMASASFAATFFVAIHIIFGLPFMGEDMPALFLIRSSSEDNLNILLSGGSRGAENSFILLVILLIYLYISRLGPKQEVVHV
jgi:membrane protease YdiL (CAAX protease family)